MAGLGDPLLLVGTVVLLAAAAYAAATGARDGGTPARLAILPPLVGALSYLFAALGVGGTAAGLGLPRYVGWILVPPLLLAVLGLVGRALGGALWGALATAAVTGVAGLALAVGGLAETTRYGALAVVWLAALATLALLYRPVSARAGQASDDRARLFSMLRNPLLLVLLGYPLAVTVSPAGLDVAGAVVASVGLLVFDLLGAALIPVVLARNVALLD